jgi:uncharacterized protein
MKKLLSLLPALFFVLGLNAQMDLDQAHATIIQEYRKAYVHEFESNPKSPLEKQDLQALRFYEPDARYAIKCQFTRTPDAEPFEMATYSGITKPFVQYGIATFNWEGKSIKISLYRSLGQTLPQYRDLLFLPFKDLTSNVDTYGGGRYIDLRIGEIVDNQVIIDFNKAYNPYCAFSDGYNCPVPPFENHLEMAIEAGEKMYLGEKRKRKF